MEWTYTAGGIVRKTWTEFDVVRVTQQHNLSAADLYELWPDLVHEEWQSTKGEHFAQQIDAAFERLFLTYMIQHHQGALTMVQELFTTQGAAQGDAMFKIASDIGADQRSEIERMQRMPNMIQAGVYSSVMHYLKAVEALKSDADGAKVVAKMKELPTDDPVFGKGRVRQDGRKIHPMYLFEVKKPKESKGPWDYYKVRATIPADQAFRPEKEGGCPLVHYTVAFKKGIAGEPQG